MRVGVVLRRSMCGVTEIRWLWIRGRGVRRWSVMAYQTRRLMMMDQDQDQEVEAEMEARILRREV